MNGPGDPVGPSGPSVYLQAVIYAGLDFVSQGRVTRQVHVWGKGFDLLPDGYAPQW